MKFPSNNQDFEGLENSSLAEEITDHFESLNKLQKKISTALVADNNFESAMEQVKNAQSNRLLKYHRTKAAPNLQTMDTLVEEMGIMIDIEALEIEANKKDANNKRLLEEALSHNALLIKEKEDLQKLINDLKKKTQDYQTLESKLAFQKEATQICFGELKGLSSYYSNQNWQINESVRVCNNFLRFQK